MTDADASQPNVENALTAADPKLGRVIAAVIAKIGPQRIARSSASPFEALARAVAYQSVSGKAAAVVWTRLKQAVGMPLSPSKVLAMSEDTIAAAGLSRSKSRAVLNLAGWFDANRKTAKALSDLADQEIVATLTGIAGIGAWTANVFLIFNLGRQDVMPASDLGIRRGVQLVYGLKDLATPRQVHEKSLPWRPYRSVASIYLWNASRLRLTGNDLEEPVFVA